MDKYIPVRLKYKTLHIYLSQTYTCCTQIYTGLYLSSQFCTTVMESVPFCTTIYHYVTTADRYISGSGVANIRTYSMALQCYRLVRTVAYQIRELLMLEIHIT